MVCWSVSTARGSSPLARGLRPLGRSGANRAGIIPARAGFTRRRTRPPPHRQDHPRSRGVYLVLGSTMKVFSGSSPLARGLRSSDGHRLASARIIPARAGFTLDCGPAGRREKDHPRSRGVYRRQQPPQRGARGSSPLARGLPAVQPHEGGGHGIIPARAGFTCTQMTRAGGGWDHPRSRGVYGAEFEGHLPLAGSSPLARGLRDGQVTVQ